MGFWTAIVSIVAITAVAGVISSVFKGKGADDNTLSKEQGEALKQEISELKQRVESLETIVTDSSFDLKRQFDKLG